MDKEYCPYCMNPTTPGAPCPSCGLTGGTYTPSPHHLPPGTVLAGRYLIGRVLGEGGFGITYIGCDLRLELRVAIKEYYPHDRVNRNSKASLTVTGYTGNVGKGFDAGREHFIQEARVMARMDKTPQIVAVRDFFQENNTAYIVMEYVDGTTFKELVAQKGGKISASELLPLVEPLFSALSAMHALGLIHRDISPDNLMLENGGVRLLDFGCARESAQGVNTMTIVLKHGYSPIEQYQHKGQGPWTDVYSLSATLYYCLTGKTPPQALDRVCGEELTPPRQLGADLTPAQEKAILRGMGMRRSQRFSSVEELHAALYKGVDASAENPEGETLDPPTPEPAEPVRKAAQPPEQVPVTVPVAQPEPEPEPIFEPEPQPEPALEPGPADLAQPAAANRGKRPPILDFIRTRWPVAAGAGAALVLFLALLVWRPWAGEAAADRPGPSQAAEPSGAPEGLDGQADSDTAFRALLDDDSVSTITVKAGTWFDLDGPIALAKALRIEQDAGVNFNRGLTVAEGGRVQVWGGMNSGALLRTTGGGTISVESGGNLFSQMLWLEHEGDLACAPDGSMDIWDECDPTKGPVDDPWAQTHYLVLDEDELFAGAVRVNSEEEFARYYEGGAPIVIGSSITFTNTYWVRVPVLIPEGVTVDAPCPDPGRDDDNCTLEMCQGTVLVNRGTLRGRLGLHGYGENRDNPAYFINFGAMDANLWTELAAIINLGDMTTREILNGTALANVGSVTLDGLLEMKGNWSNNGGTVTVPESGELALYGGTGWNNYGELAVEYGGQLANHAQLNQNSGILRVRSGGRLVNNGQLWVYGALAADAGAAELRNDGVVVSRDGAAAAGGWSPDAAGHFIANEDDGWSIGGRARWVESESELRAALEDASCELVVWNGHEERSKININGGPLTVTKGLILRGSSACPADLNSGGVTVTGENAFLSAENIDFHGNGLMVEDGGTAVVNYGETCNLGRLDVTGGGLACFSVNLSMENSEVNVSGGGRVIDINGSRLEGCSVRIDSGSALNCYTSLELIRCDVVNDGSFDSFFANLYQEGGSFRNNGRAGFIAWLSMINLNGDVSNHGEMVIGGSQFVGGTLVNETGGSLTLEWENSPLRVAGRLENGGRIRAAKGSYVETVDGGVFAGSPVIFD